jgi:hypothetical protein
MIGPDFHGEYKWLRGVEVPSHVMGASYPSGCCLALPCNSKNGCVLKINPETSKVKTFVTGQPIPNVDGGWLYHGGNLAADGFIYAIPASAPRVMKIDPREETTDFIGPQFQGKAKWYGGVTGSDGCIYGIPHNVRSGLVFFKPSIISFFCQYLMGKLLLPHLCHRAVDRCAKNQSVYARSDSLSRRYSWGRTVEVAWWACISRQNEDHRISKQCGLSIGDRCCHATSENSWR